MFKFGEPNIEGVIEALLSGPIRNITTVDMKAVFLWSNKEVGLVFRPVCSHVKVDQGFILGC